MPRHHWQRVAWGNGEQMNPLEAQFSLSFIINIRTNREENVYIFNLDQIVVQDIEEFIRQEGNVAF